MTERLVVVGGDAAGMSAASQARRLRGPDELQIVAFERGSTTSYSACGIPYWISGIVEGRDSLIARDAETFRRRQDIDARIRHEVVAIDTAGRTVTVRDLDGGRELEEAYDQLLVATGAEPVRPPVPGIEAPGVLGVQTLDDGQRVLEALDERRPETVVVIGSGYIGLEMAETMITRGLDVHVVSSSACPMETLDPDMGGRIAEAMRGMGIRLSVETPVVEIGTDADGWASSVVTPAGHVPCDLVVLGTGARPSSDLGAAAGLPVGDTGGLLVDRRQRTPVEGVWAAGDCVETYHRVARGPVAIALGTIANKQGRVAGRNLGGTYATFPGVLGTAVTKICGLEIARTGLGESEALEAGFEPVTATIESTTRAGYYPGAGRITIKAVAERGTGRLLGAQLVGEEGAAKRIDALALALWNGMRAQDLQDADLSYAPPFSPVWDPVLIAARKVAEAVDDARR